MKCELCGKNTRCSCKGGGCPSCGGTNKQVSLMNDLIKFGLSKDIIKKERKEIWKYTDKIDTYTLYEFYSNQITEEEFNQALENFKPTSKRKAMLKKNEPFKQTPNPEKTHHFPSRGAWVRCDKCGCLFKYCGKEECPMWIGNLQDTGGENPVTTDTENK